VLVAERKESRYIEEMPHRKAEAFHKTSETEEEAEVTPLL